jgi:hypothetical protein
LSIRFQVTSQTDRQPQEKGVYLSSVSIISAKERLLAFQEGEEERRGKEGYTGSTLKKSVSFKKYLRYFDKANLVRIYLHNGRIKAYEVPLVPHAYTSE